MKLLTVASFILMNILVFLNSAHMDHEASRPAPDWQPSGLSLEIMNNIVNNQMGPVLTQGMGNGNN